jgi:hypothetical protein
VFVVVVVSNIVILGTIDLMRSRDNERLAVLAVLAAAAREAEELLREPDLPEGSRVEAERRLRQFLEAAKESSS